MVGRIFVAMASGLEIQSRHLFRYPEISLIPIFFPDIRIAFLNILAESLITTITEIVSIRRLAAISHAEIPVSVIRISVVAGAV
jgi:hypothetical protein